MDYPSDSQSSGELDKALDQFQQKITIRSKASTPLLSKKMNVLNQVTEWCDTSSQEQEQNGFKAKLRLFNKRQRVNLQRKYNQIKKQIKMIKPERNPICLPRKRDDLPLQIQFKEESDYFRIALKGTFVHGLKGIVPKKYLEIEDLDVLRVNAGITKQLRADRTKTRKGQLTRKLTKQSSVRINIKEIQQKKPEQKKIPQQQQTKRGAEQTKLPQAIKVQVPKQSQNKEFDISKLKKQIEAENQEQEKKFEEPHQLHDHEKRLIVQRAQNYKQEYRNRDLRRAFNIWLRMYEKYLEALSEDKKKKLEDQKKRELKGSLIRQEKNVKIVRDKKIAGDLYYNTQSTKVALAHRLPGELDMFISSCNNIYTVMGKGKEDDSQQAIKKIYKKGVFKQDQLVEGEIFFFSSIFFWIMWTISSYLIKISLKRADLSWIYWSFTLSLGFLFDQLYSAYHPYTIFWFYKSYIFTIKLPISCQLSELSRETTAKTIQVQVVYQCLNQNSLYQTGFADAPKTVEKKGPCGLIQTLTKGFSFQQQLSYIKFSPFQISIINSGNPGKFQVSLIFLLVFSSLFQYTYKVCPNC